MTSSRLSALLQNNAIVSETTNPSGDAGATINAKINTTTERMASSRLSALLQNNAIISETTNSSGTLGLLSMPNY